MTNQETEELDKLTTEMRYFHERLTKPGISEAEREKLKSPTLDTLSEFENGGFCVFEVPPLRPDVPEAIAKLYYKLWKMIGE